MKYSKAEAKEYARANMRGLWGAALTLFLPDLRLDEVGFRRNLRHWNEHLGLGGVFISGKQGEFFSMSLEERKRTFELAVDSVGPRCGTIMSCSDQNIDTVVELGRHAQSCGADYIIVHSPILHFVDDQDETVYEYYRHLSETLDIGIALWSHPDAGYLMSPELCARIADLPNIVAIKYSVPRDMYVRLTRLAGHKILVSTSSEEEWLDNIVELGWQVYLCSTPPYLLQTKSDRRMQAYTDLATSGDITSAREVIPAFTLMDR
jgi:4-hydroxy-tetrahydrodipicolinate synthase